MRRLADASLEDGDPKKIDHLPKKNKKKRRGGEKETDRQTDRDIETVTQREGGGERERAYEPLSEYVFKDHQTALQCFVFH